VIRKLIATADDVGLHPAMTTGALRAHGHGIVTACSVVANGRAIDDAIARLRDAPTLCVGIHLTLVGELPLRKPFEIPSLVDTNGRLYASFTRFVPRYLAGAIRLRDVELELRAQIEKLLNADLPLRHANGHQHLHLLPRIFDLVVRLCGEYEIAYVRTVSEETTWSLRGASMAVLSNLGRHDRDHASTVLTNDRTIGVTELVCHPAFWDAGEESPPYPWNYRWREETEALCDPEVRAVLDAQGIELATP
jgi:chitin disaccharide deacetylase